MTVVVAVRTGSAAVLAADSKLSTQSFVGVNDDGTPRWMPQTFDHAVKIVKDHSSTAIAAFAGFSNIGEQNAVDYFARLHANLHLAAEARDPVVKDLAAAMVDERRRASEKYGFAFKEAPQTIALIAAPPVDRAAPRLWKIDLVGEEADVQEILNWPGVWVEGSAGITFALLHGLGGERLEAVRAKLSVEPAVFGEAIKDTHSSSSVAKINFLTMPVQDAMDFALFCARVQVDMERFLPGIPACGGPIDLMTLEMAPDPTIRAFPGKTLHHPQQQ